MTNFAFDRAVVMFYARGQRIGIKPRVDVYMSPMQVSKKTPIMLLLFKAYDIINLSILKL